MIMNVSKTTANAARRAVYLRTIIINEARHRAIFLLAIAPLLAPVAASAVDTHTYTVTVDSSLQRLEVEARFEPATKDLTARSSQAPGFLLDAHDCESGQAIDVRGRRMVAPGNGIRCLSYTVDLEAAAAAERRNEALRSSNRIVSPTVWMWRPRLDNDDRIRVAFRLPDSVRVSVPWRPVPSLADSYDLVASPQSGSAIAIFGKFESAVTWVADARIRVDLLDTGHDLEAAAIVDWVRNAATNVARAYGRFPNPAARVIVFPLDSSPWASDSPVYFGRVVRDGGETVELLIDPRQPIRAFYDDWTATHELSHMMVPYVRREQRWISEGFAQYYQNLLLARAGRYSEREAWQRLYEGFERGRESAPQLSPNAATRGAERNTRMKIYWSGAALALMADVELRRRSSGKRSLDDVLSELQHCCLPSQTTWSGKRFFTRLDSFLEEPLFMRLYARYANANGFPDVRPLLQQLGVDWQHGRVRLNDDAQLAEIRAALTAQGYTDLTDELRR